MELLKGSSISFIFKISGMLFSYGAMLFITQKYGAEEWGIYSICFTLLSMVILFPKFGFDNALVRIVTALKSNNKEWEIPRVLKKTITISFIISLLLFVLINVFPEFIINNVLKEPKIGEYIFTISLIIFPTVVLIIISATFQALKKTLYFMLFQATLTNGIFLLLLITFYYTGNKIGLFNIYFLATIIALCIAIIVFVRKFSFLKENIAQIESYNYKKIVQVSFPMLLSGSVALLMGWSDILMLSFYTTASAVGIYTSALKLAALSRIVLISINAIASPKFVEYFSKNDIRGLKNTVQNSTKMIFFMSAPILLGLILFSKQILGFFGDEFIVGYLALIYLCISRFINAISGSVGYIMQMTDQQKTYQNIIIIAFFINLVLNFLLIPKYGFNGAAIASSIAMVFWNVTLVIIIKKKLGFWTVYIPFVIK